MQRLSFKDIEEIAKWWKSANGNKKIEVAALEPLLWKDEKYEISDLIKMLKSMDFHVSMTSNGATLEKHAEKLKNAGLDLLRVSWHSLDKEIFERITGGGRLESVRKGIIKSLESGLDLKINRVLLKNYTQDLGDHIAFADLYKLNIKLLDLYWTPSGASLYEKYYIAPMDALSPFLDQLHLIEVKSANGESGRKRRKFKTQNNGLIEYKIKESAVKNNSICVSCQFKQECLEGYGDYFRIFPNKNAALCYLRDDLSTTSYETIFQDGKMPLRLVLEGRCNFNCGFPNEEASWCLKQGKGFSFPNRSKVIKIHHVKS